MTPISLRPAEYRLLGIVVAEAEEMRGQARRLLGQANVHVNEAIADVLASHDVAPPVSGRPRLDLESRTLEWDEGSVPPNPPVPAPAPLPPPLPADEVS